MKPLITILILALTLPLFVSAQSNYKPGYVVNLKGDTLRGFIDYQEWGSNPDAINFKKTLADPVSKYSASDITAFGIDKLESYIKYTGPISTDLTDPNKAASEDERDTSFRMGTVFLKVLEKGNKVALYSYKDELKIRFYIGGTPDYKPVELVYRITRVSTEYTYRKQLSTTAYKYNELTDNIIAQIGRLEYYESDILDIVSKINHINKTEYAKSQYSGPSFNFFAGAGVNVNTTSPSIESPFYAAGGRSYTSYMPAVFLGMNFFVNPATRKLQLRVELSEAQSQYKSLYTSKVSPYVPTEASYDQMALAASIQLIYNFYNTDNFKIFGGLGLTVMHCNFSNSYLGTQNHDGSEADIAANNPYFFNGLSDTFVIKGGVQFTKHFEFFANYLSGVETTNGGYFQLNTNRIQLGVNYIF
jgi:hypothetical protein